jgi:hypothetical protein
MYDACVTILEGFEHDEKLPLAAHAAREIFRRLPDVFGLKWDRASLMSGLQKLKVKYAKWHPGFLEGGKMPDANPQQDANLREFLRCYEDFAKYDGGSRREQAASIFQHLITGANSADLQNLAKTWVGLHDYFENVAHHGSLPSKENFTARLSELQECLLATRKREAVADLNAIDKLIGERQANGNP